METIRPCPFCRGTACEVTELYDQPGTGYSAGCPDCGAIGPLGIDEATAIELWNDRE